jgi:hypothetical protein
MMTLGNMRANGVRTLALTCEALFCHHSAVLDVSFWVRVQSYREKCLSENAWAT